MAVTIGSVTEGNANAEEIKNNSPDSELYENNKKYLQGSLVKFNDKIYLAKRNVPSDVDLDNPYYWEIFMDAADSKRVDELFEKTGNLDELETESKDNLVNAINEAVLYTAQSLTEEQQAQARANIGADLSTKMDANNPVGTGSFSMNRKVGTTIGTNSHAEGGDTTASGIDSHAEGNQTTASGNNSHAEGNKTTASGSASHAEGNSTYMFSALVTTTKPKPDDIINVWKSKKFSLAKGKYSHVEGRDNLSLGDMSHAEGGNTTASGMVSHAEGDNTTASGMVSHAEGIATQARGKSSHAEGNNTIASGNSSHAQGKFNIEDTSNKYADIIGNGTSDTARSNAATVDWEGNAWFAGDVYTGSTSGTNKDEGSKKLATEEYVNNSIAAGGTDISLGLTSASVGQIIKVKAIDESGKPTEWEAANMQSGGNTGLKKIYEGTLAEDAIAIEIDDLNSTAKALSIRMTALGSNAGGGLNIVINGKQQIFFGGATAGNIRDYQFQNRVWLWRDGTTLYGRAWMNINQTVGYNYKWDNFNEPIQSLKIFSNYNDGTNKYYGANSKIEIYEGIFPNVL